MFQYTNRRGDTYHLHRHVGRGGKPRYTMKPSSENALDELPEGYEVAENVNGQVSVRRARPRQITETEEAAARTALDAHGLERYEVEVKDAFLTIFEPDKDPAALAGLMIPLQTLPGGIGEELERMVRREVGDAEVDRWLADREDQTRAELEKMIGYAPVLRFELVEKAPRSFLVSRMSYRGDGGWHPLEALPLEKGLERYLPHLGKESFYELF